MSLNLTDILQIVGISRIKLSALAALLDFRVTVGGQQLTATDPTLACYRGAVVLYQGKLKAVKNLNKQYGAWAVEIDIGGSIQLVPVDEVSETSFDDLDASTKHRLCAEYEKDLADGSATPPSIEQVKHVSFWGWRLDQAQPHVEQAHQAAAYVGVQITQETLVQVQSRALEAVNQALQHPMTEEEELYINNLAHSCLVSAAQPAQHQQDQPAVVKQDPDSEPANPEAAASNRPMQRPVADRQQQSPGSKHLQDDQRRWSSPEHRIKRERSRSRSRSRECDRDMDGAGGRGRDRGGDLRDRDRDYNRDRRPDSIQDAHDWSRSQRRLRQGSDSMETHTTTPPINSSRPTSPTQPIMYNSLSDPSSHERCSNPPRTTGPPRMISAPDDDRLIVAAHGGGDDDDDDEDDGLDLGSAHRALGFKKEPRFLVPPPRGGIPKVAPPMPHVARFNPSRPSPPMHRVHPDGYHSPSSMQRPRFGGPWSDGRTTSPLLMDPECFLPEVHHMGMPHHPSDSVRVYEIQLCRFLENNHGPCRLNELKACCPMPMDVMRASGGIRRFFAERPHLFMAARDGSGFSLRPGVPWRRLLRARG